MLRLANDTSYGLGATVWSRNRGRGLELARFIESGSVCIKDMCVTAGVSEAPFGGRRQSGIGQVNGHAGIRGYCCPQPILRDRFGGRQVASTHSYSAKKDAGMQRFIRWMWGSRIGRWLA